MINTNTQQRRHANSTQQHNTNARTKKKDGGDKPQHNKNTGESHSNKRNKANDDETGTDTKRGHLVVAQVSRIGRRPLHASEITRLASPREYET